MFRALIKKYFAQILLLVSSMVFAWGLWFSMQQVNYLDPKGLDISGYWEFYNGSLNVAEAARKADWPLK